MKVSPRAMNVLAYVAKRPDETVTHDELLTEFWRGPVSSTNAVHKVVTELRHALAGFPNSNVAIETVPKRGYRLAILGSAEQNEHNASGSMSNGDSHAENGAHLGDEQHTHSRGDSIAARPSRLVAIGVIALIGITAVLPLENRTDPSNASIAPPTKSLAVLSFRDVDAEPNHELLGHGIATSLATNLSRAPGLEVLNPEISFQYSLNKETVPQIGRTLGVRYILDGTVQTVSDRIRATVVLYDASEGRQIYAYAQDEPLDQILKLQDKTVTDVLSELQVELDDQKLNQMRDWGTKNVQAYLSAVEGESAHERQDPASVRFAIDRYRNAIRIDPGFVGAYLLLANGLFNVAEVSADPALLESTRREMGTLRQVVTQIDPTSSSLPDLTMFEARLGNSPQQTEAAARVEIERMGVPSQRNSPDMYGWYSEVLRQGHLFREAAAYIDLYARLDPASSWTARHRPDLIAMTVGAHQAVVAYKQAVEVSPNNFWMLAGLVLNLGLIGEFEQAAPYLARLREVDQVGSWAFVVETELMVLRGDLVANSDTLRVRLSDPRSSDVGNAQVHLMLGDVEAGLADLRRMNIADLQVAYQAWPSVEHWFPKSVIDDPRYQAYLDEMGIGRAWTAQLRERAAELTPITGIAVSDSTPQMVVNR